MIDFKQLKHIYDTIVLKNVEKKICTFSNKSIVNEIRQCRFCWEEIEIYLNECKQYMEIKTDILTMNIYFQKKINIPYVKILLVLKNLLTIMSLFDINKPFIFHIILYDGKRCLPPKNETISPIHINGGFTTLYRPEIFILRTEEFGKTLIHELIHHCNTIHNESYSSQQLHRLRNEFHISKNTILNPNEAVVEFFTTILHCALLSCQTGIPKEMLIDIEIQHSIKQSNKIILKQGANEWIENTNSYCYIVLKTILLINYKKFLKLFATNNTNDIVDFLIKNRKIPKYACCKQDLSMKMMSLS